MRTPSNSDSKEKRKSQLCEAQRRRREKLAAGNRHQINIYLSKSVIHRLDESCSKAGMDRHAFVEMLLLKYCKDVP